MLDRVRAEVAEAYARTHARYAQIGTTEQAVRTGTDGFREDLDRIRGAVGLPIEVLNNLNLLARARLEYLDSIVDYNEAQFAALRGPGPAAGRRPGSSGARRPVSCPRGQPIPTPANPSPPVNPAGRGESRASEPPRTRTVRRVVGRLPPRLLRSAWWVRSRPGAAVVEFVVEESRRSRGGHERSPAGVGASPRNATPRNGRRGCWPAALLSIGCAGCVSEECSSAALAPPGAARRSAAAIRAAAWTAVVRARGREPSRQRPRRTAPGPGFEPAEPEAGPAPCGPRRRRRGSPPPSATEQVATVATSADPSIPPRLIAPGRPPGAARVSDRPDDRPAAGRGREPRDRRDPPADPRGAGHPARGAGPGTADLERGHQLPRPHRQPPAVVGQDPQPRPSNRSTSAAVRGRWPRSRSPSRP